MIVSMVLIGHMRMRMTMRQMAVAVIVRAGRHRVVGMCVMAVGMPVRVLVFDLFMVMRMRVIFGKVQYDARYHQSCTRDQPHTAAAIAQEKRSDGACKRRKGKHRSSPCRAK